MFSKHLSMLVELAIAIDKEVDMLSINDTPNEALQNCGYDLEDAIANLCKAEYIARNE